MFIQTWKAYLPVIKILLKRSASGEQALQMNMTDFQRAAGGRKVKYVFKILVHNGRIKDINPSQIAKDLMSVLQEDDVFRQLLFKKDFEFSMNSSFQLLLRNTTPAAPPDTEPVAETETEP